MLLVWNYWDIGGFKSMTHIQIINFVQISLLYVMLLWVNSISNSCIHRRTSYILVWTLFPYFSIMILIWWSMYLQFFGCKETQGNLHNTIQEFKIYLSINNKQKEVNFFMTQSTNSQLCHHTCTTWMINTKKAHEFNMWYAPGKSSSSQISHRFYIIWSTPT